MSVLFQIAVFIDFSVRMHGMSTSPILDIGSLNAEDKVEIAMGREQVHAQFGYRLGTCPAVRRRGPRTAGILLGSDHAAGRTFNVDQQKNEIPWDHPFDFQKEKRHLLAEMAFWLKTLAMTYSCMA